MGDSLRRGPTGEPGGGDLFTGNSDSGRKAPEMEHLFLWELC
jgi:hypothetical protein